MMPMGGMMPPGPGIPPLMPGMPPGMKYLTVSLLILLVWFKYFRQ